jgi:hypothetical protein
MINYYQCKNNIFIDGSSLKAKGDIFNLDTAGNMACSNYESEILRLLDKVYARHVGKAVINAIYDVGGRKNHEVRIVPNDGSLGKYNAGAATDSLRDAAPHGKEPYTTERDASGTILVLTSPGTGRGTSSTIEFTPGTAVAPYRAKCGTRGARAATCAQRLQADMQPEDTLVHEMTHSVREMEGLFNQIPTEVPGYENEEEFFRVLVQNIYISETGRMLLRKDHDGDAMDGVMNDSQRFLGKGKPRLSIEEKMNRRLVNKFVTLHPRFAADLATSSARFNPVKEYLHNRSQYPTT